MTILSTDAEGLQVEILLDLKVRTERWRITAQLRLEQREGELDGVEVGRVCR